MDLSFQTHIDPDGVLHLEGLHQAADQDVTVTVSFTSKMDDSVELSLEQHAASATGPEVAASIMKISEACSSLPILDNRSADEILGYNAIGIPE
jgi:hypothetical protein